MEHHILPEGWVENTMENYLYQHNTRTQIIYVVIVITVIVALISLPFIYVDISVEGTGIVRPKLECSIITAPVTEIVDEVYVHEGEHLHKGQSILKFRTESSDTKIQYQNHLLSDLDEQYHDLQYLSKGRPLTAFRSLTRQQEYIRLQTQKEQIQTDIRMYKTNWQRYKILFDKGLISAAEYDKVHYQYLDKENELKTLVHNQITTWQTDLISIEKQRIEAHSNIKGSNIDKGMFVVKSPVDGTIEQFSGIYHGLSVQAGTQLGIVSPSSRLFIEAFVEPKNIAYIHVGMPVRIQIEAFNYNEWGMLKGKVASISTDYLQDSNNNYLFKVKISLDKDYLTLKSTGRKGKIKKGMTAVAHFMVTRQSLFHLLYKSMDNWINPQQYKSSEKATNTIQKRSNE